MNQHEQLAAFVAATAEEFGVPGLSVGILTDGQELTAAHGVTSVDNPLPVTADTLYPLASVSKTVTATAVMRLVAQGRVELDAPVRRYVPELRLADETAAERITVLTLLNHTAGLDWNLVGAAAGDGSLASFVAAMAELPLIAEPGARASYSQAGYNLLGLVIEKVTGLPFEKAVAELVLEPVGLRNSFFDTDDIMVRRFAVGHNRGEDGELRPATPWRAFRSDDRANNPGGGLVSSVSDLLRWARFHLGTGDGVLPAELLRGMREQTVELRASSFGDGIGICWFLREVGGARTIGHGGSGNGQFTELLIVPERNFAVVSLANVGPDGYNANQRVVAWALEHYLGLVEEQPEPVAHDEAKAREVAGRYENDAMVVDVATDGSGLTLAVGIKPEIRAAADEEMPADYEPAAFGFLAEDGDEYVITEGGLTGQRGYFSRDAGGAVTGVDLAGRLFTRSA
ncbi:CubicO group peptidase (beta-lactamase class C family) [Kitasatospora sp. GP30]|uniref:serine hydrolase domain-containing protein n=1 Tax=Kitasatospora sp. GP30 TaxID=3035084 RepID=UPI000C705ACE|nr:serine hydrolase domain-containing protein [Kitasatospora sp. GP30]MDH6141524.1 CubicO group peptidase (beta-lactamase class C family) [Kitasatospora sp. GP30]